MLDLIRDVDTLSTIQLLVKGLKYAEMTRDQTEKYIIRCRRFDQANTDKTVVRIDVAEKKGSGVTRIEVEEP